MVKNSKGKRITWTILVTKHLNEMLDKYIESDAYKTKSEFVRVAVRDRLREEIQLLEKREL